MESAITVCSGQKGFILVMVLIVTAVGLLFGAGALLLFRFQSQMRIDRQHELEKVYAVRSALNYIRKETVTEPGKMFGYHTGSGRDLGVFVKPAKTFYPTNVVGQAGIPKRHFVMEWGDFVAPINASSKVGGYNSDRDYEYGAEGVTNLYTAVQNQRGALKGLIFNCGAASIESSFMRCWVNVGMLGTGGWLQENYGRRYCFEEALIAGDIVKMWLIRNPMNATGLSEGKSFGWPPSSDERPLMLKLEKISNESGNIKLYECEGEVAKEPPLSEIAYGYKNTLIGVQLAHDKASLFYVKNDAGGTALSVDLSLRGFKFSDKVGTLSNRTYQYFFDGSEIDYEGKIIRAPELRTVFEFNADPRVDREKLRYITKFKVTPGYQYDVSLVHPAGKTNLATVAQRMGVYSQSGTGTGALLYSVLTYDTHGTEHKGFRQDEKEAARNNNQ